MDKGKSTYTYEEITQLFYSDIETSIKAARKIYPSYEDYPDKVKLILIDLAFNLGETKLRKFVKMNLAINNRDYLTAARELRDSLYYTQTGKRAKFHCQELLTLGD